MRLAILIAGAFCLYQCFTGLISGWKESIGHFNEVKG